MRKSLILKFDPKKKFNVKQGNSLLCAIAAMSIKCTVISLSHVQTDIISFKVGFDERKCKQNHLKDKYTNIHKMYSHTIAKTIKGQSTKIQQKYVLEKEKN